MELFSKYKEENDLEEMKEVIPTKREKNLVVKPQGRFALWVIAWEDNKGVLPKELRGKYTSSERARKDIQRYITKQKPNYAHTKAEREEKAQLTKEQEEAHAEEQRIREQHNEEAENFFEKWKRPKEEENKEQDKAE